MVFSIINAIIFPQRYIIQKWEEAKSNSDANLKKIGIKTLKDLYNRLPGNESFPCGCKITTKPSSPEEIALFSKKVSKEEAKAFFDGIPNKKLFEFYFHPSFEELQGSIEECFKKRFLKKSDFKIFSEHDFFLEDLLNSDLSATQVFRILKSVHFCSNDFPYLFSKHEKLTSHFMNLFMENPFLFSELLYDPKYNFKEIKLDAQQLENYKIHFTTINPRIDPTIAKFFTFLLENKIVPLDFGNSILRITLRLDLPETSAAIAKFFSDKAFNIFEFCLEFDSIECFKKLCEFWKDEDVIKKWNQLIDYNAPKCLGFFLSKYKFPVTPKIIEDISNSGLSELLLTVHNNDLNKASLSLFYKIYNSLVLNSSDNPAEKENQRLEIKKQFIKIFRFSPFERVEQLFTIFVKGIETEKDKKEFVEIYEKAKTEYLRIAPFISHHVTANELQHIKNGYLKLNKNVNLVDNDLKYGMECRSKVEELLKNLKEDRIKQPSPHCDCTSKLQFGDLPPSSKGTYRAAALLEKISEYRADKQKERSGEDVGHFHSLRQCENWMTPIDGRYFWAYPLTISVFNSSTAKATSDLSDEMDRYALVYKNSIVNVTYPMHKWCHGAASISSTWPDIENIFEELMTFNLTKPADNSPGEIKRYQERLTEFYSKAAELVWLIGNTQPLERGSGTFAEWMFAIVHLANGLEPPTLKKEFPQLDVLDITFPLSDYKKFFSYFFEPSTMPEYLRRPSTGKSLFAQIEDLYK